MHVVLKKKEKEEKKDNRSNIVTSCGPPGALNSIQLQSD